MDERLKINEIFYSIQGEGEYTGVPSVFIRFAGCNLNCDFCDTKHDSFTEMTVDEIINKCDKLFLEKANEEYNKEDCSYVITGGEPTIQPEGLKALILRLSRTRPDCTIQLETNGTNSELLRKLQIIFGGNGFNALFTTVSPKKFELEEINSVLCSDSIKLVYQNDEECDKWTKFLSTHLTELNSAYIQPCSEQYKDAVDYVLRNPLWSLSVQIQKVIGVK